jgi:hypothetical protein
MLIKIKKDFDFIKVHEKDNGAILVTSKEGKNITAIDARMPGVNNYLEKIDKIQGDRIKKGLSY